MAMAMANGNSTRQHPPAANGTRCHALRRPPLNSIQIETAAASPYTRIRSGSECKLLLLQAIAMLYKARRVLERIGDLAHQCNITRHAPMSTMRAV